MPPTAFSTLLAAVSCIASLTSAVAPNATEQLPNVQAAREHAYAFFNSIHAAMRQFGSSDHHNGLSFYLAQAPQGSVFYHGGHSPNRPPGFEWLAFEIEHSAVFAMSFEPLPERYRLQEKQEYNSPSPNLRSEAFFRHLQSHGRLGKKLDFKSEEEVHSPSLPQQRPLGDSGFQTTEKLVYCDGHQEGHWPDFDRYIRGYFHTYRANRPLNFLYIDGQGAAKSRIGTLDGQDHILLGWDTGMCHDTQTDLRREWDRAKAFCALAKEWSLDSRSNGTKIDGFIRMEAGFEIIYCDYSPEGGLDQISVQATPFRNETGIYDETDVFFETRYVLTMQNEWLRTAATRFHGHPAGRLEVDWSSMVSAFAYPLNLSNPNADRPDLPRVINATKQDLQNVHTRLIDVIIGRGGKAATEKKIVNWQSVVDKIVTRYSERLWMLANTAMTADGILALLDSLIDPFTSYLDLSSSLLVARRSPVDRCIQDYLETELFDKASWTPEDEAIVAAIETVSQRICKSLFAARDMLRSNETIASAADKTIGEEIQKGFQELLKDLRWSTWKECGTCPVGTICSIPLYPAGDMEDYLHPTCKTPEQLINARSYWI